MRKLTHNDLIKMGTLLGYNHLEGGLCQGLSGMWAQAILAEDEEAFYARLHFMAQYVERPHLFKKNILHAQEKVRTRQALSQQEAQLLSVFPFYDGLSLYLSPNMYRGFYRREYVSQRHIKFIYTLTRPQQLSHTSLYVLLNKPFAFNRFELKRYFNELAIILRNYEFSLPILLNSPYHTICLRLNQSNNMWEYVDTNDFDRYPNQFLFYRSLNTEQLARSIFQSFEIKQPDKVMFTTSILSLHLDSHLQSKLNQFNAKYVIRPENDNMSEVERNGLLLLACAHHHIKIAKRLIQSSQSISQTLTSGATALHLVAEYNQIMLIKLLMEKNPALIHQTDKNGSTALFSASGLGHLESVRSLISYGAKINHQTHVGATPLFIACQLNCLGTVRELLRHCANLHLTTSLGASAFIIASYEGNLRVVRALIDVGANIHQVTPTGETALYGACEYGHTDIVAILLQHHAQISVRSVLGLTPCDIACQNGYTDIVALLVTSAELKNEMLRRQLVSSALLCACNSDKTKDNMALFELLVSQGANLTKQNKQRQTALDLAFLTHNISAIRTLLCAMVKQNKFPLDMMSYSTFKRAHVWAVANHQYDVKQHLRACANVRFQHNTQSDRRFFQLSPQGLLTLIEPTKTLTPSLLPI